MAKSLIDNIFDQRPNHDSRFIPDYVELKQIVKELKEKGYKIVLTQGVYDLIHEGHALYLEQAKKLGDILIVGVDTDELTKMRKGPTRPIVPQSERLKMLVHLRAVDIVTLREAHHDINEIVECVSPDVFVVSETTNDFAKKRLEECQKYCGEIVTLAPQATTSTTARIRNLAIEGAENLAHEVTKLTNDFLEKIRKG